jgi:hypothetical protein
LYPTFENWGRNSNFRMVMEETKHEREAARFVQLRSASRTRDGVRRERVNLAAGRRRCSSNGHRASRKWVRTARGQARRSGAGQVGEGVPLTISRRARQKAWPTALRCLRATRANERSRRVDRRVARADRLMEIWRSGVGALGPGGDGLLGFALRIRPAVAGPRWSILTAKGRVRDDSRASRAFPPPLRSA